MTFEMRNQRTLGRCYRRWMDTRKEKRLRKIIEYGGYNPYRGYIDYDFVDGRWQPTGKYIKYMQNSRLRVYFKSKQPNGCADSLALPEKETIIEEYSISGGSLLMQRRGCHVTSVGQAHF